MTDLLNVILIMPVGIDPCVRIDRGVSFWTDLFRSCMMSELVCKFDLMENSLSFIVYNMYWYVLLP